MLHIEIHGAQAIEAVVNLLKVLHLVEAAPHTW